MFSGGGKLMNKLTDQLIFEVSRPGRRAYSLPTNDVETVSLEGIVPTHQTKGC